MGLMACTVVGRSGARADGGAVQIDRVLAVVDGRPVTWLEVQARMPPFDKALSPAKKLELIRAAVARRIDAFLVAKAADALRLRVEPEEVERGMAAVAANNHLTVAELAAAVRQQGLTLESYRAELAEQILEAKLLQRKLTAADVAGTEDEKRARAEKVRSELLRKLRAEAQLEVRL